MVDKCKDILSDGIFATVNFEGYDKLESGYHSWIHSLDEQEARKATDAGVDLTLPLDMPVPLKADFTQDDWNKWKSERNNLTHSKVSRATVVKSFSRHGDTALIAAWLRCIELSSAQALQQVGLSVNATAAGDILLVDLNFRFWGPANVTARISDWFVSNATKESAEALPTHITNNEFIRVRYKIEDQTKDNYISIVTDRGALVSTNPGTPPPIPVIREHKQAKQDLGANPENILRINIPFAQRVRIFGGIVAKWNQANSVTNAFLQIGDTNAQVRSSGPIYLGAPPIGKSTLSGLGPWDGNQVGPFDEFLDVPAGELRIRQWVGVPANCEVTQNLLAVEYVDERPAP